MSKHIEMIAVLLQERHVLHCSAEEASGRTTQIEVVHRPGPALDGSEEVPPWFTPSLAEFYKFYDGLGLYTQPNEDNDAVRMYSLAELKAAKLELQEVLDDCVGRYAKEYSGPDLRDWLAGLMPIAEFPETGDRFCVDTCTDQAHGEKLVRFLDHEAYYGGYCDPQHTDIYADTPMRMILRLLTAPVSSLLASWRGFEDGEMWIAEGISETRSPE